MYAYFYKWHKKCCFPVAFMKKEADGYFRPASFLFVSLQSPNIKQK
jgi:hypothetical protein